MPTTSTAGLLSAARKNSLPIHPKPLMPTLIAIIDSFLLLVFNKRSLSKLRVFIMSFRLVRNLSQIRIPVTSRYAGLERITEKQAHKIVILRPAGRQA
jgi:hypothetical protein